MAITGLEVHHAATVEAPSGFEAGVAVDAEGRQWLVQVPTTTVTAVALETEITLLRELAPLVEQGTLPFTVPQPAGFSPLLGGGRAVVFPRIVGSALVLAKLYPGPGAAASLGRAIAAIHELPRYIVEDSGLPSYSADDYRRRHLAMLDEAAQSGRIPRVLLRRWEAALENVSLWRFTPVVCHASLSEESVIMAHGQVSAIVDWAGAQIADPADDLAWLVAGAPADTVDSILEAYQLGRTELLDPHLLDRAHLLSELALVRWLSHGVRTADEQVISEAVAMMNDLLGETTETGTFNISHLKTAPPSQPAVLVSDQDSADPSAELVVTTDAAFEVPAGAQFEVPAGAQFEVPAGTKVPNYDRATPPGPHADDQTSTFAVLDPDEAQATD